MENNQKNEAVGRKKGIVISDGMDKTIVVEVTTILTHKKYLKKYKNTKRYSVHDPNNKYQVGDAVFFCQSRPISKSKKWVVVE